MKRQRIKLFLILLLAVAAIAIDLPRIPVHINLGRLKYNGYIDHVNINWDIGGTKIQKNFNTVLGLDLSGGSELVLQANMAKIAAGDRDQALESARTVIENRVNLYGVSEPNIYTEVSGGVYKIVVDLAGVKDINQAKQLIGQTAELNFYTLKPGVTSPQSDSDFVDTGITGSDLTGATIVYEQGSATPSIQLLFKSEGLKKFSNAAVKNVGKSIYILLDGQVISNPTVSQDLASGVTNNPVITGSFTTDQAKTIVTQLDAGALPVPVSIIEESTVSASLGQASIVASLAAGIIGICIVLLFIIWNYKILGIFADVALMIYALVTFAIFKTVPITLTLAGIAGFILSVGIAVDANILIFERTKEELRKGKTQKQAIELGFKRAWPSIRDSNVSSLITTVILYSLGTSTIKGFALTLALGVLVSLFTAVFVSRTFITVFGRFAYLKSSV